MGGRPQVVVEAKAVEAERVDARVAAGARTPSQDLRRAVVVVLVVVLAEEAMALVEDSQASEVETMAMMMTLTSAGRRGMMVDHRGSLWLIKSHAGQAQLTPQLRETCHLSISLIERRELGWVITYWIELQRRRERYMRQGCRGGW